MKAAYDRLVVFCLAGLVVLLLGWVDSVRYLTAFEIHRPVDLMVWHKESQIVLTVYWADIGDDPANFVRGPTNTNIVFQKFSYFHLKEDYSFRGCVRTVYDDCTIIRIPYWAIVLLYLLAWAALFLHSAHRGKRALRAGC